MTLNQYVINMAITEANTHRLPFSTTILNTEVNSLPIVRGINIQHLIPFQY